MGLGFDSVPRHNRLLWATGNFSKQNIARGFDENWRFASRSQDQRKIGVDRDIIIMNNIVFVITIIPQVGRQQVQQLLIAR